ncbi:hypothetical protein GCM10009552_01010 [Rothia nasimurium]
MPAEKVAWVVMGGMVKGRGARDNPSSHMEAGAAPAGRGFLRRLFLPVGFL